MLSPGCHYPPQAISVHQRGHQGDRSDRPWSDWRERVNSLQTCSSVTPRPGTWSPACVWASFANVSCSCIGDEVASRHWGPLSSCRPYWGVLGPCSGSGAHSALQGRGGGVWDQTPSQEDLGWGKATPGLAVTVTRKHVVLGVTSARSGPGPPQSEAEVGGRAGLGAGLGPLRHGRPAPGPGASRPPPALLFKVAAVRLALFLKTIPVLEPSSTRPAVTTKNVCRVTATSEEVGGGRRPRMGPQSGWN